MSGMEHELVDISKFGGSCEHEHKQCVKAALDAKKLKTNQRRPNINFIYNILQILNREKQKTNCSFASNLYLSIFTRLSEREKAVVHLMRCGL